jgi:hypothetical protein
MEAVAKGETIEALDGDGCDQDDIELNSGVEAPGSSLEGFVGSTMNFESENFKVDNDIFLIEIGIPSSGFTFKFVKPERVFIG